MNSIKKITVVGAGTMGHSIAMVFALGKYKVSLCDLTQEVIDKARNLIDTNLQILIEADLLDQSSKSEILNERIDYETDLYTALKDTDYVLEAVVEDAEVKKALFADLETMTSPHTILASNTSYFDIFSLTGSEHLSNYIITHWFNPPHIIPLVEIVTCPQTSPEVVKTVKELHDSLGKTTIVLNKFLPGFIGNRLQLAMGLEMWYLIDNGYATVEEIDKVAKASFGLRTPILGICQRQDFTGLDLVQKILANKSYRPPEVRGNSTIIDNRVSQGRLGIKSGKGLYDYSKKDKKEITREYHLKVLKLKKYLDELGPLMISDS